MPAVTLESRVKIGADILCREIEGEAVVLNTRTGVYFGLDPMGTRIWHLMKQAKPLSRICRELLAEFQVDEKRCREDVLDFTRSLQQNGLVTVSPSA